MIRDELDDIPASPGEGDPIDMTMERATYTPTDLGGGWFAFTSTGRALQPQNLPREVAILDEVDELPPGIDLFEPGGRERTWVMDESGPGEGMLRPARSTSPDGLSFPFLIEPPPTPGRIIQGTVESVRLDGVEYVVMPGQQIGRSARLVEEAQRASYVDIETRTLAAMFGGAPVDVANEAFTLESLREAQRSVDVYSGGMMTLDRLRESMLGAVWTSYDYPHRDDVAGRFTNGRAPWLSPAREPAPMGWVDMESGPIEDVRTMAEAIRDAPNGLHLRPCQVDMMEAFRMAVGEPGGCPCQACRAGRGEPERLANDAQYMHDAVAKVSDATLTLWLEAWGMPKATTRDALRERVLMPGAGDVVASHLARKLATEITADVKGLSTTDRPVYVEADELADAGSYFMPTEDELWLRNYMGELELGVDDDGV